MSTSASCKRSWPPARGGRQSLDGLSVCYVNAWEFSHPGEPGRSFTTRNPLSPHRSTGWPFHWIDHIYVRCGRRGGPSLGIAACELAFDQPVDGTWASDHFALVADLVLPTLSTAARAAVATSPR